MRVEQLVPKLGPKTLIGSPREGHYPTQIIERAPDHMVDASFILTKVIVDQQVNTSINRP